MGDKIVAKHETVIDIQIAINYRKSAIEVIKTPSKAIVQLVWNVSRARKYCPLCLQRTQPRAKGLCSCSKMIFLHIEVYLY